VICDGNTNPDWVAMDLFSQAEHDEMAQAILLCPDWKFIDAGQREHRSSARGYGTQAGDCRLAQRTRCADQGQRSRGSMRHRQPHRARARRALGRRRAKLGSPSCAMPARSSSENTPPKHWAITARVPNHVLPTARTARFSSPLGVYDFQKRTSVIQVSRSGAKTLGAVAAELAMGEGLPAHALAARYRLHG
jgi:histidinol dehydrogenase